MRMNQAFSMMLGSLHAVHAGRSQVMGVLAWRDTALLAARLAASCHRPAEVTGAGETPEHGQWMNACACIVAALRAMEPDAEYTEFSAREAEAAAAADRDMYREMASEARDPVTMLAYLAQAGAAERARLRAQRLAWRAYRWRLAANDAAGQGELLAAAQDRLLTPVGQVVTDMGGDVANAKTYHQN